MSLKTSVKKLNRIAKITSQILAKIGIRNVGDLLYYFPFRYEDYRKNVLIKDLVENENVTIKAKIEFISNKRSFRSKKLITESLVRDESGVLRMVWFNQPFLVKTLKPGEEVYFSGKVHRDMLGFQMVSPGYEKAVTADTKHTARLVPIYPLTEGLTQKQMRFFVGQVLEEAKNIKDWLPTELLQELMFPSLEESIRWIHFPGDELELKKATERLKFDEIFLLQLKSEMARQEKAVHKAPIIQFKEQEIKDFVQKLPFKLTKAQKVATWEILQDIAKEAPMNRLVSGDVGSGKTVVAAISLYNTALNNFQSAIMAPTEILAVQHYNSMCKLLGGKLKIGLLTNSKYSIFGTEYSNNTKAGQKREFLENLKNKKIDIVVGTHALLSENVEFNNLALVVVDEQHRFGVEQRKVIKKKGENAHFLSMTATPIPRSLALMIYGDLDVSLINEMPPGRKKILTRLVQPAKRVEAYKFIKEQVSKGRQVFVVCPLIEQEAKSKEQRADVEIINFSEKKSVMAVYERLSKEIFPDLKIGFLHGKMKGNEKDEIMAKFKNKEIDILVSTSVVEVGVDIPNATVMMIEDAERFGLAQLHQFRGRVGRSEHQSYCFLFTSSLSKQVEERLKFFESINDGFMLAEKDLEMRGPGEVYGTVQSGMMNLRIAKLTDFEIIKKARESAKNIIKIIDYYPGIMEKMRNWEQEIHLE